MFIKNYIKTKCVNGCNLFNDSSKYLYWENRNVTKDEIEIVDFLNAIFKNKKISVLHIGIGNSYVASMLKCFNRIDGISISTNEINVANGLNINNYKSYFFNKFEYNVFSNSIFSKYDVIIDVNLKSFSCCEPSFKKLFTDYNYLLNQNGIIITGKRGMNWSRMVKPVIRFSFKKFFYKRLKEFDGPKENFLTLEDCSKLASIYKLRLLHEENSNVVFFEKK